MKGFIEIVDKDGIKHLLNVRYIEEVREQDVGCGTIYFAFNFPNAIEQDYFYVSQSYDEIVALIKEAVK